MWLWRRLLRLFGRKTEPVLTIEDVAEPFRYGVPPGGSWMRPTKAK